VHFNIIGNYVQVHMALQPRLNFIFTSPRTANVLQLLSHLNNT